MHNESTNRSVALLSNLAHNIVKMQMQMRMRVRVRVFVSLRSRLRFEMFVNCRYVGHHLRPVGPLELTHVIDVLWIG